MKYILFLFILSLSIGVKAQKKDIIIQDQIVYPVACDGCESLKYVLDEINDSLQAERFFLDSLGNQYMVEYRYVEEVGFIWPDSMQGNHLHHIALCRIIKYRGNKQQIVLTMKAIYSPTECKADCTELWLKRVYDFQNRKQ